MELKNTLKVIGISLLGVLGVGLSCVSGACGMTLLNTYHRASAETTQESVSLTASELNENSYEHLANSIVDNATSSDFTGSYIIYNDVTFNYYSLSAYGLIYSQGTNQIIFSLSESDDYGTWDYMDILESVSYPFNDSITIYSDFIVENLYSSSYPSMSLLESIIALLTGGITGIASGVGSGVSTLVSDIFIQTNALSVFGGILVVFAGISLAIGLSRWIMNFLTSLGAKK